jgi:hypothetical protein
MNHRPGLVVVDNPERETTSRQDIPTTMASRHLPANTTMQTRIRRADPGTRKLITAR